MASYLGYGPPVKGVQPSIYRKAGDGQPGVPATSAMLLGFNLNDAPAIASVRWQAGPVDVTTQGASGRVDLRPAVGAPSITATATLVTDGTSVLVKPTRLVAATDADETAYSAPAVPAHPFFVVDEVRLSADPVSAFTDAELDAMEADTTILHLVPTVT